MAYKALTVEELLALMKKIQGEKTNTEFAADLGIVERVEVLPFHQLGRYKWKELGLDYTLNGIQAPTPEMLEGACDRFRKFGLKAY